MYFNQKGAVPLLFLIAILGVVAFLAISWVGPFEGSFFNSLFSKPSSHAAEAGVFFVNQNGDQIAESNTSIVRVQLNPPWPVTAVPSAEVAAEADIPFIKPAYALTSTGFKIIASVDDVVQSGNSLDLKNRAIWFGTGDLKKSELTGLRFRNLGIPKGAVIKKAEVQVKSNKNQWIGMDFDIWADNSGNSPEFSTAANLSSRVKTGQVVKHSSNARWVKDSFYSLGSVSPVIQEIVNRQDWKEGNNLTLIFKGTGSAYARKFTYSFDSSPVNAPRVVIEFDSGPAVSPSPAPVVSPSSNPTKTPTPAASASPSPVVILSPSPSPTPVATVVSAVLAEDSGFTKNAVNVQIASDPSFVNYTFSDTSLGTKTIYAKFKSSDGQEKTFSKSINIVAVASPSPTHTGMGQDSMAMHAWREGGKNAPNTQFDKCDDGTDVVSAHNKYFVTAYDGFNYPTWHPAVVINPVSGNGKCYFGHEHGTDPQKYMHWNEMVQHFGKDMNGDGQITAMTISADGKITEGDRAGIPFGIANQHMDQYYNQEARDSIFVRHEDHVGHKIELVNNEAETVGNSTHSMTQLQGTNGINVPYYKSGSNTYQPTGVVCTHLHKFHQGTSSADAIRNNLHEVIFHSACQSVVVNGINAPAVYPGNNVLLTGMMAFGKPGEYLRFCFSDRSTYVCADGKNADGSCVINDPLISKLPDAINSSSLGRNMVDKYCFDNFASLNPGVNYFNPYEIWEGDLRIQTASGDMLAEHGRQWDVMDPIRYVDPAEASGFGYNQNRCNQNLPYSGNCDRGVGGAAWNSPQAAFKGLQRTTYFGRNRVSNQGGPEVWWTDPLGGNAVASEFPSGLKQKITPVEADIQSVQALVQKLYGSDNFLNDRALQRYFNDGGGTVHAPN